MKSILLIFVLLTLYNCNSATEKNTDFGAFQIDLPTGWEKVKFNGIDSYVGGITNGTDTLTFDYGWYSYDFRHEDTDKQLFATDTINGKIALITKPKNISEGMIGLYIEKASKKNHFNLIGKNIKDEESILNIFKSIKFKDSDTLINSKTFEFTDQITPYSGRSLFYINCASCHQRNRKMIGPALANMEYSTLSEWILGNERVDSIESKKEFGKEYHRLTFGEILTKNDIEKLIEYTKLE